MFTRWLPILSLFVLLLGRTASADILLSQPVIRDGLACTPACAPGEFEWSFLGAVSQNERVSSSGAVPGIIENGLLPSSLTKDFFTIFDFLGYVPGSEQMPAGWGFQSMLLGSTPSNLLPSDDPTIPNGTWFYNAGPAYIGPQLIGVFSLHSIYGNAKAGGNYIGSATNDGTALGSQDNKITQMLTPTAVPEPASLFLFGAGLLGLVGLQRRRARQRG